MDSFDFGLDFFSSSVDVHFGGIVSLIASVCEYSEVKSDANKIWRA